MIDPRADGVCDGIASCDRLDASECAHRGPSFARTFLSIIDDDRGEALTEGHRETSVEILKGLFRRAFGDDAKGTGNGSDARQGEDGRLGILIDLFSRCSLTFQKRMSRCDVSSNVNLHYDTTPKLMEPSEHIRHLLVELMVDLGGYCLNSWKYYCIPDDNANRKVMIEATANVCQTLAKSTFLDPYPEVQNAACTLAGLLAQLCPLAVRMNAASLLVPLTGRADDTLGGAAQSNLSNTLISKKCLFRHRHSKTRCEAVVASAAIVMCCPRAGVNMCYDDESSDSESMHSVAVDHLSSYASQSTTMEQIMQDTLLPGWEDLLKLDSSASVQSAVMKSLGNIANILDWGYFSKPANSSQPHVVPATSLVTNGHHNDRRSNQPFDSPNMVLTSAVETRVLTLFLMGMSAGSVTQVRTMAVQHLNNLQGGATKHILPLEKLDLYYQPMLELMLRSCSLDRASCRSKVRSLEALQVLLIISIPLMNGDTAKLELSDVTIRSLMGVVSTNILSDEKDVLNASLAICRIIGANNLASKAVVEIISSDTKSAFFANDHANVDEEHLHSNILTLVDEPSPRHMTSFLLILDGMMKGSVYPEELTSILRELDPTLAIPTPDWLHSSPSMLSTIGSFLCHPSITKNTAANSLLAWSLMDACDSFAKCAQVLDDELELTEDAIICVSVSIAYLLGCPEAHGLSSCVMNIIASFSTKGTLPQCNAENSCVLDVYFRQILAKIMSAASSFPWKQTEPAFLATDALIRTCSGSTVGRNFDMVLPFFISHLSATGHNISTIDGVQQESLNATKDEQAEDYSLRITLMALLQTILSDESFYQTFDPRQKELAPVSILSDQLTILLSLVLPNLVWRPGSMASALRKLAVATLFCLLNGKGALIHPEIVSYLIPILLSNLEDTESTTRELSCVCLSLVLQQVSSDISSAIGGSNTQNIDSICPRLLELLDDCHSPVRLAACRALKGCIILTHASASNASFKLGAISLTKITSSLLIHLDDPEPEIKDHVFQVLAVLIELQCQDDATRSRSEKREVVEMIERRITASLRSHQDGSNFRALLEKIEKYHEWQKDISLNE
ncbi:hypothetical protein ACHAW5_006879 [Stephanodiscus triporus]|uniref:Uncharacterized protein n=1 Tax=Stephanodiscus triporus TaxID=2934178 RepID=A0ABD3MUL4_9STRA